MTDEELKQLVESNARTIQAMLEQQTTDRLKHEERMSRLEQRSDELQDAIVQAAECQRLIEGQG